MQEQTRKVACGIFCLIIVENCRIKKKKCDGAVPVCSTCKAAKAKSKAKPDCYYQKSTKYYQMVEAKLLDRIEYLENQLNQGYQIYDTSSSQSNNSTVISNRIQLLDGNGSTSVESSWLSHFTNESLFTEHFVPVGPPIYFSPYNFGNIFEELQANELSNGMSIVEISISIRRSLMETIKLFSCGRFDDSYKLFFLNYSKGRKYNLLYQNAIFNFPTGYPKNLPLENIDGIEMSSDAVLELQILWSVFLKVDIVLNTTTDGQFIIQETDPLIDMLTVYRVYPGVYVRNMALMEELSPAPKVEFLNHIKKVRQYRYILSFYKMKSNVMSLEKIQEIALLIHNSSLDAFKGFSDQDRIFDSFEYFTTSKEYIAPNHIHINAETLHPYFIFVECCSLVHSKAIQSGFNGPVTLSKADGSITYTSQEVLLSLFRALKYLVTQFWSNHGLGMEPVEAYQFSLCIVTAYEVSKVTLVGLTVAPVNRPLLEEALSIIKDTIHPFVVEVGWNWGVASYYASEMQKLLRAYSI
ncbi:hypothetical protein BC833DRAFT_605352 [Globomyces pollinis-pini]|nr:hypothetical protein BC833DRAFT_605352 [Globomyces pollinis-pini]